MINIKINVPIVEIQQAAAYTTPLYRKTGTLALLNSDASILTKEMLMKC